MYEWVKSGSSIRVWLVNYNSIAFILEIFYEKNCRSMNELCTNLIFSYKKILKDFFIPPNLNCIYIIRKIYYIKNYQIKLKIIYYYFSKIKTALLFWWCKNGHLAESSIVLIWTSYLTPRCTLGLVVGHLAWELFRF